MYSTIAIVIAILKTGAYYVQQTPSVIFIPPAFSLVTLIYWLVYLVCFAFIYSTGDVVKGSKTPIAAIKTAEPQQMMIAYFIFGGLWKNAFFDALSQFVLASSVCIWYFAGGQKVHEPFKRSFHRAFRYHLGSLAFGSFILAVVQFIRLILAYVAEQVKKNGGS